MLYLQQQLTLMNINFLFAEGVRNKYTENILGSKPLNLHLSLVLDQLLEIPVGIWLGLSCWTCMPQEVGNTLQIPAKVPKEMF